VPEKKSPLKIEEMYVVVVEDENEAGDESVPAATLSNGMVVPLIAADHQRLKQIIPMAEDICATSGTSFRVRKFYIYDDVTDEMIKKFGRPEPPSQIINSDH
jgi:hypothetical protein